VEDSGFIHNNNTNASPNPSHPKSHFWLIYLVLIAIIVGIVILLTQINPSDTSGILIRNQSKWQRIDGLPVDPQHIAVADSIWIVDDNHELIRFESFNGAIWSSYQVQPDDTIKSLSKTFHISRRTAERRINELTDNGEIPVGQQIWIEGYRTYTPADIGIASSASIRYIFASYNFLWVVAEEAETDVLIFFDGQSWHRDPSVQIDGRITAFSSITTVQDVPIVVTLDDQNILRHLPLAFQPLTINLTETRQSLNLPPIPENLNTTIALTSDDTIFVLNDTLLSYDGASWNVLPLPERDDGQPLSILGTTNNTLWLHDSSNRLWQRSSDNGTWQSFAPETMGIAPANTIHDVTSDGHQTFFATDSGILAFDGERWSMNYRPTIDAPVQQITSGDSDQIWAVSKGRETNTSIIYAALLVVSLIAIIGVFGMSFRALPRLFGITEAREQRTIIQQAINEQFPEPDEKKGVWEVGWRRVLVSTSPIIILAVIGLVLFILWGPDTVKNLEDLFESIDDAIEHLYPNAPAWLKEIIRDVLFAGVIFVLGLPVATVAILRTKDPEKRARLRLNIIAAFSGLLFFSILETLAKYFIISIISVLILLLVLLIVAAIFYLIYQKYLSKPNTTLSEGDYDTALAALEKSIASKPDNMLILWTSGATFVEAGRFERAEELLRQSIRKSDQSAILAAFAYHPLQHLGAALNGQKRYAEAKDALDAALNINKNSGYAQLRLAETHLFQNESPELALELLEKAYKNRRAIFSPYRRVRYIEAEIWADRAWAYSLSRQFHAIDTALENAFAKCPTTIAPLYAGILWRAGKTMQIQHNSSKARHYFRQSLAVDPNGAFAIRAHESLQQIDSDFI
jgi:tetratricopeptide (TPR) repeat protein